MSYHIKFDLKDSGTLPWSEIRMGRPQITGGFVPPEFHRASFWFDVSTISSDGDVLFLAEVSSVNPIIQSRVWRISNSKKTYEFSKILEDKVGEIRIQDASSVVAVLVDPATNRVFKEVTIQF